MIDSSISILMKSSLGTSLLGRSVKGVKLYLN